ncbi:hypothetical protein AAHA92_31357 [Salvia divinorum]|uniref:Uncharacterized protein n=1 Tax=Salvia divinorum TaxID=28513 RepID=A0ABD1FTW8_SALDI
MEAESVDSGCEQGQCHMAVKDKEGSGDVDKLSTSLIIANGNDSREHASVHGTSQVQDLPCVDERSTSVLKDYQYSWRDIVAGENGFGATNHVTSDLNNLNISTEYTGGSCVQGGRSQGNT